MTNATINRFIMLAIIIGMIAFTALLLTQKAGASAPSGLPATIATSTQLNLASRTATTLIATSSCAARIISTGGASVMLTFSDYNNAAPTGIFGVLQPASTTKEYDSGQYGCGLVKAYADAATVITFTDSR